MVKISWFVPHKRYVYESQEEIREGYLLKKQYQEKQELERLTIKEYKDEAHRPWWKFFDEYEYRYISAEANRHDWWRWYEKGMPTAEKKLLLKLDILITFCAFVGYWVKSLDSANFTNAYVSGMKEDLSMKGNDLINIQVLFTVGNIILDLPFLYALPRINTTYLLFFCELGWSVFTLAQYKSPNVASVKAFRFIVGGFEAAYFPCIHHLFANWYKPTEVTRRAGFFYFGLYLGTLTSGLLQSGIYNGLNGVNAISGWRWMFLIDGCISFGVAFITLFSIPGTPFNCYSLWLTDDEIKLARFRMRSNGSDDTRPSNKEFLNYKNWIKIFKSWHFWIFTIGNIGGFNSNSASSGSFALWLKSLSRYSVGKLDNLTAVPPALGIFYVLIVCWGSDIIRKRFLMITFCQSMNLIGNIILAIWDVSEGAKWFAFFFGYWSWAQSSVFYPLMNDVLRKDSNTRAIEWTLSYILGMQSQAWISRLLFPTVESPKFHKGFTGTCCFAALQAVVMAAGLWFYKRDERKDAYLNGILVYNSTYESVEDAKKRTEKLSENPGASGTVLEKHYEEIEQKSVVS